MACKLKELEERIKWTASRRRSAPLQDWALIRIQETRYPTSKKKPGDADNTHRCHHRLLAELLPSEIDSETRFNAVRTMMNKIKRRQALDDFEQHSDHRQKGRKVTIDEVFWQEDDPEDQKPIAFLFGRTSGFTAAFVNGLCDEVAIEYATDGGKVVVIGRLLTILDIKGYKFSRPGDCGAPVYDRYARVMGTLIRGSDDDRSGLGKTVSYVLPIDETLKNIEDGLREGGQDATVLLE